MCLLNRLSNRVMTEPQSRAFNNSLIISMAYVGLGTLSVLSLFPSFPLSGQWAWIGVLITFPVSFIGFGIAYMEPDNYVVVLLAQAVVFGLFWFIVYRLLLSRYSKS